MKRQKKDVWKAAYREEKRKVKRCIYPSKKKVNEQLASDGAAAVADPRPV